VRATRSFDGLVSRVAVLGGSGGEYVAEAKKACAQALVTGEAKHHHWLEAESAGILLIEAGHFETERCFVNAIFDRLQERANALQYHLGLKKAECMQAPSEIV
jgi:putative NIF3 family GTP cyclohydrolase 1 type 2